MPWPSCRVEMPIGQASARPLPPRSGMHDSGTTEGTTATSPVARVSRRTQPKEIAGSRYVLHVLHLLPWERCSGTHPVYANFQHARMLRVLVGGWSIGRFPPFPLPPLHASNLTGHPSSVNNNNYDNNEGASPLTGPSAGDYRRPATILASLHPDLWSSRIPSKA